VYGLENFKYLAYVMSYIAIYFNINTNIKSIEQQTLYIYIYIFSFHSCQYIRKVLKVL